MAATPYVFTAQGFTDLKNQFFSFLWESRYAVDLLYFVYIDSYMIVADKNLMRKGYSWTNPKTLSVPTLLCCTDESGKCKRSR
jgi:hypothetical protein